MAKGEGKGGERGEGKGEGKGEHRETLKMRMIILNTVYSIMLLSILMTTMIGLCTYQWIETTAEKMTLEGNIQIPANVPGLNKVSCGLLTYCIDAAGEVAECTLPWPRYGGNYDSQPTHDESPVILWNISAAFIIIGWILVFFPWLYSLVSCFGCFRQKLQQCGSGMVLSAGIFYIIGLMAFGASFDEVAVNNCTDGESKDADGKCPSWKPVFPSAVIEGSVENIGCRICAYNMAPFQMSSTCTFGWGGFIVLGAFLMTILTSFVGYRITKRAEKSGWGKQVGPASYT